MLTTFYRNFAPPFFFCQIELHRGIIISLNYLLLNRVCFGYSTLPANQGLSSRLTLFMLLNFTKVYLAVLVQQELLFICIAQKSIIILGLEALLPRSAPFLFTVAYFLL
mmetsp:Transcript_3049/g.4119  ORF Transcript_3049/g.4119 Transcript_3049/m.4119 type:complete len:109 (+) Transcript_3049:807-1133(+)